MQQISWICQNIHNFYILDAFEGSYGYSTKKKMFLKMRFSWVFFLNCHNFFQMHPMCKIWVCFDKFRKFAAKWAQEFSKLIEKWLRKLSLKLATPSRNEKYLQLSVYLSKLGSFWSILDREQNKVAGGMRLCIPKWTLCRWVCTSQLWYYEIFKCNKRWLDLDRFSWWPCRSWEITKTFWDTL